MTLKLSHVRTMAEDIGWTVERAATKHGLPMHDVWDQDDHYLGRFTLRGLRLVVDQATK